MTDQRPEHPNAGWQLRFARTARSLHRWIGAVLAVVMAVLAVTGGFVAFKKQVEYLQPATRTGAEGSLERVIPPAEIAEIVLALDHPEATVLADIDRIELRPGKRVYKVRLAQADAWSSPRELQLDAITGAVLNEGPRGDQLWMDLHSFAVFGTATKLVVMVFAGLSLLWLGLSGLYLFFFPRWYRARKRARRTAAQGQERGRKPAAGDASPSRSQ